jgi:hypothetical protein
MSATSQRESVCTEVLHVGRIISKSRLFEALAYERLAKVLRIYGTQAADQCNIYQKQAIAEYRKWGAIAKAEHLDHKFRKE